MTLLKVRYNSGKEICKVKIEREDGALLENWTIMLEDFPKLYKILKKKYGFESANIGRDLEWAK